LPVLKDEKIVGIVTIDASLETLSNEQEEDYNQLAGLTGEHEDDESIGIKVKRRIPWLAILICLDLVVCLLISAFEGVISKLTVLVLFQPVILGLSGNVGTQSLAVCVRSLANNELSNKKQKFKHILSELRNGFALGLIVSILTFVICFGFLKITKSANIDGVDESIKIAVIVASSILTSLTVSSLFGCMMPILFNSLHIDPAAASGPFITTINDLLAITTYFTLASILMNI
nr:magnesium transporter [Bacilli bacterium]